MTDLVGFAIEQIVFINIEDLRSYQNRLPSLFIYQVARFAED